ncbi:hypothetical protein bcCo53_001658 (plasmid) [Borrelia coriaceae]|uniref:hypothetical protein n=1 Tax=Borrelia coriaceae TaxID=144 RepID=UPI001FF4FB35|nr:hypothetical protein [Borrelia coriaceae]UPA17454.1 hypothetical protein bcCo53_001658 [Borrelia coriaceae]
MLKILLFLTAIINIFPTSKEEYDKYHKFNEKKRKLVRVKNWQTNFNNLKKLGVHFTHEIDNIKYALELSDQELSLSCKYKPNTNICSPLPENRTFEPYKYILEKFHSFTNPIKHKNPDQTAYLIYEIYDLETIFGITQETIYGFNENKPELATTYNLAYKKTFETLKNIYYKAQHDLDLATNILKQNYTDNNFNTFMLKFIEIHKLATHAYFNIYNLLYKCIHSQSTEEKNKYCKYT